MSRRINEAALEKIKRWEGLVLYAYDDHDPSRPPQRIQPGDIVRGTLTIGYGHTGNVRPGMEITEARAEELLRQDLRAAEGTVERLVKVRLNDAQFAALVSFCFNVGAGNFGRSTLLRKLNAGDYGAVPNQLARWVHSKGRRMDGLVNRRAQEAALWGSGEFVSSRNVGAEPEPPAVDRETVSWAAGILASLSALFAGSGPVQWALGAVIVVGFGVGLFFWLRKRWRPA
ncbi:MAG: hypothetical protein Kow0032_07220 [Methyloligellaceae bacterium]